jgi:prohibitin 1
MNFPKAPTRGMKLLFGGALASFAVSKFCFVVNPGERVIIFDVINGGIKERAYDKGIHFMIPFMQRLIRYDTRISPYDYSTFTGTKDLQRVHIKIKIFFRPDPDFIQTIHLDLNKDYASKVLPSVGNEVLKAVIAQYDADELLKQREKISSEIKEALTNRANEYHIVLEDVSIYELKFQPEFMASIERKQVAQQEAEAYKYVVMLREEEMKANIIEAEGKSIAAQMVSDAVAQYGEGMVTLRKIEASKEIVSNLSSSQNVGFLPAKGNILYNLNP